MTSSREERLQMRQRGAGTREIKAVDFGFSFGGPALGPSEPAPLSIVPEPAAPTTSTPPTLKVSQQSESQREEKNGRTPGSARNSLPQRPSTYDIPSDDVPAQPRSIKRRKPNPPNTTFDTPSRQNAPQPQNGDSVLNGNGETGHTEVPSTHASEAPVADPPQPMVVDIPPESQPLPLPESTITDPRPTDKPPEATGGEITTSTTSKEQPPRRPGASSDRARSSKLRETQSVAEQNQPRPSSTGQRKSVSPRPSNPAQVNQEEQAKRPTRKSTSPIFEETEIAKTITEASSKPKRPRGRPSLTRKTTEVEDRPQNQAEPTKPTKRPRGRPSLAKKTVEVAGAENIPPDEATKTTTGAPSKPKRPRGRPSVAKTAAETTDVEDQPSSPIEPIQATGESSSTATHRGHKKAKTRPEPLPAEVEEPQAQEQESPKARRGRPAKKAKPTAAPETEAGGEEVEVEVQEAEPAPSKPRRGRPGKKTKRPTEAEEQEQGVQSEEEALQETRRKTREREPRGETVPVTVHRLTNASALGSMYADESGGREEESADELSSRQKTKLPSRGGVNPADVLSQICRETLEKTLATLKNGIANESNPTRRAEWTRKRKAVESFGSELDGRLLDLSEMLDSNFVLGVQLKNSKREMMDLRSHLYKVRRERESIALHMDAVRAKHMEEENEKTGRATINNSLHSLELALDRSQHRPSTEPSSADVEFMLRTVADVSSRTPGAQGGLLNRIRAFNAQLESTAQRLERK
ncbi:uncharacterized protein N7498_003973 [Penicillium cinerascens]|uniref:Inner kinetochore subunit AME1 domain-containing protein n=1 Tax=Penicillium cinerascens TaxID=70096 RepID=A0A9W9T7E2_9EURO|nr:uncharacterized protein N7498_003973 [Penicillium cinerascens]KAJ5212327.1 hypothetical protein N7498_003973 [Penicillium cinerascens]